jgi:hypothetical protein
MSLIKPNKVIIPNDYKEIILDEQSGSSFSLTETNITVYSPSLESLSSKMSYVAEVYYKCNESDYIPVTSIDDDFFIYTIGFEIFFDKNVVSKYRFFRFYLTPNIIIKNGSDKTINPKSMKVYMNLKIIIDSETTFTTTFQRSLPENNMLGVPVGHYLLLRNTEFTFIFDSLNGTITDEAPDVFGRVMDMNPTNPV